MEMMPKIREFRTSNSAFLTTKLLHAKRQDGQPAFNFMDLRRLSIHYEDEQIIRHLLQNAKSLEKLHLSVYRGHSQSLVGFLSPSARTLKVLDLTVDLQIFFEGLCEELEALAGHNMLEALSFEVRVALYDTEDIIGLAIQKVENVLVKSGWSALREVSINVAIPFSRKNIELFKLEAIQSLPDRYLNHLSKLDSIAFKYSATSGL